MKKILYLTFYFRPDLCAGSFRNSPLLDELAKLAFEKNIQIDVFTTLPNRYSTFSSQAEEQEEIKNVRIQRIAIPQHKSGIYDQINSFKTFYQEVYSRTKKERYDMVFASSSRLFTAFLGYRLAKKRNVPLYLDIRDIFVDTINEVLKNKLVKTFALPVLKQIEKKTFGYASHINLISEGFKPYFNAYQQANYSYFSNGIDQVFIDVYERTNTPKPEQGKVKRIIYAGNIGDGQGLHKIVPEAANLLREGYEFVIIGDGGMKKQLLAEVEKLGVKNVIFKDPMDRASLIDEYTKADFLFLHLNDYEAFKKVLPSKIFELAMFKKIILAGVNGYARKFISDHLPDSILFFPGNSYELVERIKEREIENVPVTDRSEFIENFNREAINHRLAVSILNEIS